MGPFRAAEIIREGMFRGVDNGYLITDRKFAGADTLATSYVLSLAIKKIADYDIVMCGRQAIDGDTAQVGPQTAEKLGLPQITYAEEILSVTEKEITVKRRLERGIETVSSPMPVLVTVHGSAADCRARNTKLLMKYKHARTVTELQNANEDYLKLHKERPYLKIEEWNVADLNADEQWIGLAGSPTKVKKVDKVVLQAKDVKVLTSDNKDIDELMKELITNNIIG